MICPGKIKRIAKPEDLVTEVLRETTTKTITVELVNSPQEEDRWNKLIQKNTASKSIVGAGVPAPTQNEVPQDRLCAGQGGYAGKAGLPKAVALMRNTACRLVVIDDRGKSGV